MVYPAYGSAPASPGSGTAIAAVVLSFIGVVWFGLAALVAAAMIIGAGKVLDAIHQMGMQPGAPFYEVLALSAVQVTIPIFLIVGAIQLLRHRLSGRRAIAIGCVLILVSTAAWAFALFGTFAFLDAWNSGLGGGTPGFNFGTTFAQSGVFWQAIPAAYAVVTMICALSPSTRLWCCPSYSPPPYGHPSQYGPPPGS